jgi:ribosomal protein L29
VSTLLTHEIHAPKPPVSIAGDFLAKARALKEEDAASTPRARAAAPRSPARAVGTASNSSQAQSMNARRFAEGYAQQQRNPPVEVERKKRENLSSMLKSIADQHAATPVRRVRERRQEGQQPEARKVDSSAFLAQTPRNPPVEDERKNREKLSSMLKEIADQHAATPVRRVRERRQEGQQSEARVGQQPENPKKSMLDGLKVEHEKAREETDAEHQKQVDALKADHATLKADHAALKADHDALKAKKDAEHQKQVDALKADHAALKADHDALKAKKDAEHQKQVDALKADHATLKAAHAALKADHDALKDEHDALKGEHELDTLEAALEMKLKSLVAICDKTRGGISALHRSFLRWRTLASLTKLQQN